MTWRALSISHGECSPHHRVSFNSRDGRNAFNDVARTIISPYHSLILRSPLSSACRMFLTLILILIFETAFSVLFGLGVAPQVEIGTKV